MKQTMWLSKLWDRVARPRVHRPTQAELQRLLDAAERFSREDEARLRSQSPEEAPDDGPVDTCAPGLPRSAAQSETDAANTNFWEELCGSQLARSLGVVDHSAASLRRFDDFYYDFYPYLQPWLPLAHMRGRDVLEIGLGHGTLSQTLAAAGARYRGLDIAAGPVNMVRHRLSIHRLPGGADQGSILNPPYEAGSFDYIVAIGSLHHTGDLQRAIDNCRALLRPAGTLCFMVYYAYSYRQVIRAADAVLAYANAEASGARRVMGAVNADMRAAYDTDSGGRGAPHTDFISRASLRWLCRGFPKFEAQLMNIDTEPPFQGTPRPGLLKSDWPSRVGLDLYATATKKG